MTDDSTSNCCAAAPIDQGPANKNLPENLSQLDAATPNAPTSLPDALPTTPPTFWFDDNGKARPSDGLIGFGTRHDRDASTRAHLMQNLGMVRLELAPEMAKLQWDLKNFNESSLAGALEKLSSIPDLPGIELQFNIGGWRREFYADLNSAMDRIFTVDRFKHIHIHQTTVMMRQRCDFTSMLGQNVRYAWRIWQNCRSQLNIRLFPNLQRLLQQTMILIQDDRTGIHRIWHLGPDTPIAQIYGPQWAKSAIGQDPRSFGDDPDYEDIVCSPYDEVFRTRSPRLDHVRALIHRQNGEPLWATYERLLLPWYRQDGRVVVMVIGEEVQNISIPFMVA